LICKVSWQVYNENFEKALAELALDARGVSTSQNGEVNTALLRTWLRKLRQICTHPQVGQLQKSRDKSYKPGVLKTMKQVLEGMKDQNWRNVIDDRRSRASFNLTFPSPFVDPLRQINEMAYATQIMQHEVNIDQRAQKCLDILLRAEREADEIIAEVLSAITKHDAEGVELKAEAASLRAARGEEKHFRRNFEKERKR
jgi:E3 ubiquitin-protein ligase SHPRH